MTSSISERTSRISRVSWNRPRVIEGRINAFSPDQVRKLVVHQPIWTVSPRPKDGSSRSHTANTRISRMPIKKVGSDMPIRDTAWNSLLDQCLG